MMSNQDLARVAVLALSIFGIVVFYLVLRYAMGFWKNSVIRYAAVALLLVTTMSTIFGQLILYRRMVHAIEKIQDPFVPILIALESMVIIGLLLYISSERR